MQLRSQRHDRHVDQAKGLPHRFRRPTAGRAFRIARRPSCQSLPLLCQALTAAPLQQRQQTQSQRKHRNEPSGPLVTLHIHRREREGRAFHAAKAALDQVPFKMKLVRARESREGRLSSKRGKQSSTQGKPLRAQRRRRAANATKGRCALRTAKGARNFVRNVDHANVASSQMVVKGNLQIPPESLDVRFAGQQAIKQMACRTLFRSASFAWRRQSRRTESIRFSQQAILLLQQGKQDAGGHHPLLVETGLLRAGFPAHEQIGEVAGPRAVVLLPEKQPFAQQRSATPGMASVVRNRAGPRIMHTGPLKLRGNANRIPCFRSPTGMSGVRVGVRLTGIHQRVPSASRPVSSWCKTGVWMSASLLWASTGSSSLAARACIAARIACESGTPHRSAHRSAVLACGSTWETCTSTAMAAIRGPSWTEALTSGGKAICVSLWQRGPHVPSPRSSVISARGWGTSIPCRRSIVWGSTWLTSARPCWQYVMGARSTTESGVSDRCRVWPAGPGWPPTFVSLFLRRLFVFFWRTKRSEDGGNKLF